MAEGSSGHSAPLLDASVTAMGTTTSDPTMYMPPFITNNTGAISQDYTFTQPVSMPQLITITCSYSSSHVAGIPTFPHAL